MKKDNIPFNDWSQERIKLGKKFCTSRHKRYYKDDRVEYISEKMPWRVIRRFLWQTEGADSPEELQEVIEGIHKRKVSDDELFYVHFGNFKEVIGRSPIK